MKYNILSVEQSHWEQRIGKYLLGPNFNNEKSRDHFKTGSYSARRLDHFKTGGYSARRLDHFKTGGYSA